MTVNEEYVKNMAWHNLGQALLHPVQASELRIGDAGYFDDQGNWNRIGQITDAVSLAKHDLKPVNVTSLYRAPLDDKIEWGPLIAQHVKGKGISTAASAAIPNPAIPASASFQVEYSSSTAFGAVLVCTSPIHREAYYFSDPFKQWVVENSTSLASNSISADIKKWGLFIVTQTYSTKKYTLTTWNDSNNSVSLGFDVDVQGGATLKAGTKWYEGRSITGWRGGGSTDPSDDLRVVFVSGVLGKFTKEFWSRKDRFILRGDEIDFEAIGRLPKYPKSGDEEEEEEEEEEEL